MEYLSSGNLNALIKTCGCLDISDVRFYTAETVCGFQFLHGHNIVHRDLKPDNSMLDAEGHIRIIDLGLAHDGVSDSNKISGWAGFLLHGPRDVSRGLLWHSSRLVKPGDACVKHLKKLLRKNPEKRLGVSKNIREHPFFSIIGWEELEGRRVAPPCRPNQTVLKNLDMQWPEDTEAHHPMLGFPYMSPSMARWMRTSEL